jgi:hypothetical protein
MPLFGYRNETGNVLEKVQRCHESQSYGQILAYMYVMLEESKGKLLVTHEHTQGPRQRG